MATDPKNHAGDRPRETVFFGALHDLERVVTTHLFVICPNNSGSTFLKSALTTSRRVWSLPNEGRRALGYVGARAVRDGRLTVNNRVWASRKQWLSLFQDSATYDWTRNRRIWYFQAYAYDPRATVFVEKTPWHLLVVDDLARHFRNARFLFMVRNPYAMCEGICRVLRERCRGQHVSLEGKWVEIVAARHVAACLEYQRRNVEAHGDRGIFFTYETMSAEPERVAHEIRMLVPELDDLNLRQRLPIRQYDEMLTDMNARQIARLTPGQIAAINRVFRRHRAVLNHFGYEIMDRLP